MCFGGGSSAQSIYDEKDKSELEKPLPSLSMSGDKPKTAADKPKKKKKSKRRNLLNPYGSEGSFNMDAQSPSSVSAPSRDVNGNVAPPSRDSLY
tara:strand:+ start:390 stop:671 length:282 start_codon:yes stop_codon:yes gene_type:complete